MYVWHSFKNIMPFKMYCFYSSFFVSVVIQVSSNVLDSEIYDLNLPPKHMAYYFYSHPEAALMCENHINCPYKDFLNTHKCWGYEEGCSPDTRYSNPLCDGSSKGWSKSKTEQINTFFRQGDFGFIRERMEELTLICSAKKKAGSSLECTTNMRFCRGKNIMFNFESLLHISEPMRYREDVIKEGQVGGFCKLKYQLLKEQGQHKSPLQSWYAEFEHFTELLQPVTNHKICDVILDKPTFVMKLDAMVNMYHHFCDFLNLYASLHLNDTFSTDIYIVIWDTIPYYSNFIEMWKAFTKHPVMDLSKFKGKKVCIADAVFPLLPRMIFGMYYNMPLIPGCSGSGLFQAFAEHIQHRLNIKVKMPNDKIRITLISRGTQYRRILNEDELIDSVLNSTDFLIQKVNFNRQLPFLKQLEISYNTDILIGIHGAGLTHMLFMPVWGAVFEIYNCDDENCYADLARLRGLNYLTWQKADKLFPEDEGHHPTLGAHAKFTNYSFDVKEFLRLLKKAANHVKNHKAYTSLNKECQDCDLKLQKDEL